MINRFQFFAHIDKTVTDDNTIKSALKKDRSIVSEFIRNGEIFAVALFECADCLYLYAESEANTVEASVLFPELTGCIKATDECGWQIMKNVYYTCVPVSEDMWCRKENKTSVGRIGKIIDGKVDSYVYYHKKIMEEGLFEGDKYLCIGLYGNTLFLYSETPAYPVHLKSECSDQSVVIEEWRKQNPRAHFDHDFAGEKNFVDGDLLFSLRKEDFKDEQCI